MARTATRTERIEARVTPDIKALLVRAAQLTGEDLSAFIIRCAKREAEETVKNNHIVLSVRDSLLVAEALLNPPEPSERLIAAAEHARAVLGEL